MTTTYRSQATGVVIPVTVGIHLPALSRWLGGALTIVSALAAAITLFVPGVLRGPEVMNGSARGLALVILCAAVPVLAVSLLLLARGSVRAVPVAIGSTGFLAYNAVMYLFATPFNALFLVYVAMLSLAVWSLITTLHGLDVSAFRARFGESTPVRAIAAVMGVLVGLNALAWLATVIPALVSGRPAFLTGTGLTTSPVYVQDLSFWLPVLGVGAVWLWQRRPWGYVLVSAGLAMWVLEALSIAADQWFAHAADPASPVASAAGLPIFSAVAVIAAVPLAALLRGIEGGGNRP